MDRIWIPCTQVEHVQNNVARYTLRCASVIYEILIRLCRGYPFKVFSLLQSLVAAPVILQDVQRAPCLFDEWSLQHVRSFPTEEQLCSQESLACPSMMATVCVGNVYNVECMHSKHSRKSKGRAHTHTMALEHLAIPASELVTCMGRTLPLPGQHVQGMLDAQRQDSRKPAAFAQPQATCARKS